VTPEHLLLRGFELALSVAGLAAAWTRRGSKAEDEIVATCHDLVLDSLTDADMTRTVDCITGRNWRDQLTVAEAEDLRREADLRKFERRN